MTLSMPSTQAMNGPNVKEWTTLAHMQLLKQSVWQSLLVLRESLALDSTQYSLTFRHFQTVPTGAGERVLVGDQSWVPTDHIRWLTTTYPSSSGGFNALLWTQWLCARARAHAGTHTGVHVHVCVK